MKKKKWLVMVMLVLVLSCMFGTTVCAAGTGDVAGAIEGTWKELVRSLFAENDWLSAGMLSDIMGGAAKGKFNDTSGHPKSY